MYCSNSSPVIMKKSGMESGLAGLELLSLSSSLKVTLLGPGLTRAGGAGGGLGDALTGSC